MAINKKLIHFKNKENFEKEVANENILDTSICFIQDSKEISTHGTIYKSVNWSILTPPPPISLCDIAYWNGNSVKTIQKSKWNSSLGTPLGVVVIPENMLPDGRARIIGCFPPDELGNPCLENKIMPWSNTEEDTSLTNYTYFPTTDNTGSTTTGAAVLAYFPSDIFTGTVSFVDAKAYYQSPRNCIPSPYLGNENTINPEYIKDIIGNEHVNSLSDFNGLGNTEVLINLGTDYVAATACYNYKDGVSSGINWYLPTIGELGFLMVRVGEINSAISLIGGIEIDTSSLNIWSSTEVSSTDARTLTVSSGSNSAGSKTATFNSTVRAFGII